jgi:hypothetical protein
LGIDLKDTLEVDTNTVFLSIRLFKLNLENISGTIEEIFYNDILVKNKTKKWDEQFIFNTLRNIRKYDLNTLFFSS